MDKSEVMKV